MGSQRTTAKKPKTKSVKKTEKTATNSALPALIPRPNGRGALLAGGMPGNKGGGRPPDEIRAKLRNLANGKALPFLSQVLDGKITLSLLGKCDACAHEQPISEEWVELLVNRLATSDEHRIRVSEMLLRHGLASKEIVVATDEEARRLFACLYRAFVERHGAEEADLVRSRAAELYGAKE